MTDRARSEFNTWWERQPFKDQFADVKEQMGNVWVASREECVVEIDLEEWPTSIARQIQQSIEAAGLKVKP